MIFCDVQFASLFAPYGQSAESPWRLALVSLLQFAENLSDRRAADAVRSRVDWKYLLGLELTDLGFDASVLSEFRSRLVAGGAQEQLLDTLLAPCREQTLVSVRGRQRTAIGRSIDGFYNPVRRRSTLDYISPVQFERLSR
jgi:transposase